MAIWHQVTVTRLRAPLVSSGYGNQARDWTAVTSTTFQVAWAAKSVAGVSVTEVVGDNPQTVNRIKLTGGPELNLESTDRIVGPDGFTYEVDGEVMRSYDRGGQPHHMRAMLRRITTG